MINQRQKIKLTSIILIFSVLFLNYNLLFAQTIHWQEMNPLPKPMRGTAITCNNKIYFMEADKDTSGIFEYDSKADHWQYKGDMITPGWNLNLAAIDTIIYAIGGDPFLDRLQSYHPGTNRWQKLTPMPTGRQHSNCAVVDGKIYVMGGRTDWSTLSDKNEVYDPVTNSWQTNQPLPIPTENPILAAIDHKIYALCGDTLRIYDPATDQWTLGPNALQWVSVMWQRCD
jgi:N-acetylneuraminic acid mutarotase